MDLEQLDQGSYKGVPFLLARGTVSGGNKNALHSYVNSNRQTVENLGTKPRSYPLNIILPSTNYRQRRDALLAALEDPAPGPLIHPLYGRIENVVAQPYTLNEDLTSLGDGKLSVTFEIDNGPSVPEQAGLTVSQVAVANAAVATAVQANITGQYNVTPGFLGSFESALSSVQDASAAFKASQAPLDKVDELLDAAQQLEDEATALILAPANLASRLTSQFDTAASLLNDPLDALAYYRGKFDFGSDNGGAEAKTAAQIESANNKAVFNSAMRALALSYSYVAAAQRSYATLDEVQAQDDALKAQYDAVADLPGTDTDTREALADLRQIAQEFLDAAKLTARRIINVRTHPTTARLLSFRYYGDDTQGEGIANLNDGNVSNLSGDVQVLTQ
jgi:prophage DNA circulation protein